MQFKASHAIKNDVSSIQDGAQIDIYEVPGGFEGSPWDWPACCC